MLDVSHHRDYRLRIADYPVVYHTFRSRGEHLDTYHALGLHNRSRPSQEIDRPLSS